MIKNNNQHACSIDLLTRLVIPCENCSHYITNPRREKKKKKRGKRRESKRPAFIKGGQNQKNQIHALTATITVNISVQNTKKCTGSAVLPVRRDRGKVEGCCGKTVTLAMPPARPRRSQSRWGLRCLVPASRSSDRLSISPLSIHPQADYSVITRSHPPSQLTRLLAHSLPLSRWKAVTIHMSEADA